MKIAITGSTGLIGSALAPALEGNGHTITRIVRPGTRAAGIEWNPAIGQIDLAALEDYDAVVHLAGESIFGPRWTAEKKRRILESREQGTRLLATSLAQLQRPPGILVSASAIGFYGNRPADEPVDEDSHGGSGFLNEVVRAWEGAAEPASAAGIRVAHPRFGLVLTPDGGALKPMLTLFRFGLGGKVASGKQIWSWVALDDVIAAIQFILLTPALAGPVNVASPHPVTNLAFTRTLGRVLRRPTVFPQPEFVLKALMGEMAEELLISGARVVPRKLKEHGFAFRYPELEETLRFLLSL